MKLIVIIVEYDDDHFNNLDESALFYRSTQFKSLNFTVNNKKEIEIEIDWYTFLLCTNMSEIYKMDKVIIERNANPKWFKGVNDLQVHHISSNWEWMKMSILQN